MRDERLAAPSTNATHATHGPPGWRIEVRDTGPGIAASQQSLVFEEFYQLHNPQRDAKYGLGLGLAVAKRMAERMNLSILLKSAAGQGAVFAIAAPAAPCVQSPPTSSSTPAAFALPGAQLAGLQALVVDDDASSGQALADLLRGWDLHVTLAGSAEQARDATVSLLAQGRPQHRRVQSDRRGAHARCGHGQRAECQ